MLPSHVAALVDEICSAAARAPSSPRKSAAALLRRRCSHLSREKQQAVRDTVMARLAAQEVSAVPQTRDYYTIKETAALMRTSPRTIKRRLRTPSGRHSLGWPRWDGYRWLIPVKAINPATAPEYFRSLPDQEPWPPDSLPAWVEVA